MDGLKSRLRQTAGWAEAQSETLLTSVGVILILCLGLVDYLTGTEISFSIFYLAPILFVTWFAGVALGIPLCVVSACTWLAADLLGGHDYSHPAIAWWNAIVRLAYFVSLSYGLAALRKALDRETLLARTDPLTGVDNTRGFIESVQREILRARRTKRALSLAYLDLDNFKSVNDSFGHSAGDSLLKSVARTMKDNVRATDTVGRIGGDEFGLLLPETGPESAHFIVDRVRSKLLEGLAAARWPVTMSIGLVTHLTPPATADDMLRDADSLMYTVKESTKNGICQKVIANEPRQDA